MANITISYPESGLTIAISVRNMATGSLDFSGTMTNIPTLPDIWPTNSYKFDFIEVADTDYIYRATATWYNTVEWAMYRDAAGWSGWLTPTQATQLANTVKTGDTILNLWEISIPL